MTAKVLGTLGFHAEKFLPAVLALPEVQEVYVYTSSPEAQDAERRAEAAVRRVQSALHDARVPVTVVRFADPYDVAAMLPRFVLDLRRLGPRTCVVNVTGGTKAMAVAAALACLVTGARAVYLPEDSDRRDLVDLPLPALTLNSPLTPGQARVLRALAGRDVGSEAELARAVRLSPATVSHHLRNLRRVGAVRTAPTEDGRKSPPEITDTGRVALVLHDILIEGRHSAAA